MRPVRQTWRWVVPNAGPTERLHYYRDCVSFSRWPGEPVLDRADVPERALCWTCVSRMTEAAERAEVPVG